MKKSTFVVVVVLALALCVPAVAFAALFPVVADGDRLPFGCGDVSELRRPQCQRCVRPA